MAFSVVLSPKVDGIDPMKVLFERYKYFSNGSLNRLDGSDPVRVFLAMFTYNKAGDL